MAELSDNVRWLVTNLIDQDQRICVELQRRGEEYTAAGRPRDGSLQRDARLLVEDVVRQHNDMWPEASIGFTPRSWTGRPAWSPNASTSKPDSPGRKASKPNTNPRPGRRLNHRSRMSRLPLPTPRKPCRRFPRLRLPRTARAGRRRLRHRRNQ